MGVGERHCTVGDSHPLVRFIISTSFPVFVLLKYMRQTISITGNIITIIVIVIFITAIVIVTYLKHRLDRSLADA